MEHPARYIWIAPDEELQRANQAGDYLAEFRRMRLGPPPMAASPATVSSLTEPQHHRDDRHHRQA